jgi:hypothetical protein
MNYRRGDNQDIITLSIERPHPSAPEPDPLTPQQKSRAIVSAFLKLAAFGCALFTVALLAVTAFLTYRLHDILTTRPHAQAEVQSTEIYSKQIEVNTPDQASRTTTFYGFRCVVDYTAASRPYESQVDIGYQRSDRSDMASWSTRIQPGDHVEIAYKPDDPAHIYFAGDFTTAYAPALFLVRYTAWLLTISALAAAIAHRLRLPNSNQPT